MRSAAALALAALVFGGCLGGKGTENRATPTGTPEATATPTAPVPTPTPDPLLRAPASRQEAAAWLNTALAGTDIPGCPEKLRLVDGQCLTGLLDGDALQDAAYLIPVKLSPTTLPFPATVFVWRGGEPGPEPFAGDLTADASVIGRAFFDAEERNGEPGEELAYLQNTCTAAGCRSRAVVLSWDGTAWRDIGPLVAVANIDSAAWEGSGASSSLAIHGGKLPESVLKEAGPTRAATTTYGLKNGRYEPSRVQRDPPEYLYHAIEDADIMFETDKAAAITLYEAAIGNADLKDWKPREDSPDRRPVLEGYALWRIALATAALGSNPAAVLDEVIGGSEEPLFDALAEVFRRGFLDRGGVIGGCAEVNLYLTTPVSGTNTPAYIQQRFDYGYANPPGSSWLAKLCPF